MLNGWSNSSQEAQPRGACMPRSAAMNSSDATGAEGWLAVDYTDQLRRLAINDARFGEDCLCSAKVDSGELDPKMLELVRLAALIAAGGAVPSYGAQADAAVNAGATAAEIVDVLVGITPIVGLPCIVAAAPKLATALGYDIDEGLEYQSGE
jgi:4-carboxymuconolactone decarboxylase